MSANAVMLADRHASFQKAMSINMTTDHRSQLGRCCLRAYYLTEHSSIYTKMLMFLLFAARCLILSRSPTPFVLQVIDQTTTLAVLLTRQKRWLTTEGPPQSWMPWFPNPTASYLQAWRAALDPLDSHRSTLDESCQRREMFVILDWPPACMAGVSVA